MYPAKRDLTELGDIFPGKVPDSVETLLYNVAQLNSRSDPQLLATIKVIYKAFMAEVDDAQRKSLFLYLVQQVQSANERSDVILPFIQFETNHHLVTKAVWAYLQCRRSSFEDPFSAICDILELLARKRITNRGAVFAGLVCFGDRRVCAVLRTVRHTITIAEARAFAHAATGPLHRPTIEFCAEWLIDLVDAEQYEIAIQIASALSAMVINDSTLLVHDSAFNFGPYAFSHSTSFPDSNFDDLLDELSPILETLADSRLPALNRMIEIFKDPAGNSLEQLDLRKVTTRRLQNDRRVSDRRIVSLTPRIERRGNQRRNTERRLGERR